MDESTLIERLVAIGWKGSRAVLVGPGDDAAVLRGGLVISTDMMVEGVHFDFDWIAPAEVGFRAGAAALSDMAAMGARPGALLVSMAVSGDPVMCEELQRGLRRAGDRVAAPIVGGDVGRSPGPAVVDVVAVGRARAPVLRSGAEPGEDVWVSGELGGAGAAVAAWSAGVRPAPAAKDRFAAPPDRVPLGVALAGLNLARAMIDVSDGLVTDARRIARASGVELRLRQALLPLDPVAGGDLKVALEGGEDYELMFTAPPGTRTRILELGQEMTVRVTRIGSVERGAGVVLEDREGRRIDPGRGGYDHFAAPPGGQAP
ncbi:MAG: thiamine-phosphate kinase [Gemmatimonadetes bacterium]|nr:thiamine-phosphate kinase [Gemmatimonadota bacterium]MYG35121.1 thiamine-phosphate kinase [Gemmatimonadota bacterium]